MNTIQQFTPNYTSKSQNIRQNVQFTGNLGDKYVNQVLNGSTVKPKDVIKEMKGTFGFNGAKVEDILESFIGKVKQLFNEKQGLMIKLNEKDRRIAAFPQEQQEALNKAEQNFIERFKNAIQAKDSELAAKNKEVEEMKLQLSKYEQVAKVKSVEELDTVMPNEAIQIIDKIVKNKVPARRSMVEFLFTGKGQEDAIKQIERNNAIIKAKQDGICNISEVGEALDKAQESGIYCSQDCIFTLRMIENALKGAPNGNYIKSSAIKQQVKENAMSLLSPMVDEKTHYRSLYYLTKELDKALDRVEAHHDGVAKGIKNLKARSDIAELAFVQNEFSPESSKVIITAKNGYHVEHSYCWLADYGNSN